METGCLESWQALDLVNVQLALDEQAGQVANFREACLASRKSLAVATRAFKQDDQVRRAADGSPCKKLVPKLLRSYQEEVDRLTQRSKFAENCFLAMYRLIREAPDPCRALSAASKTAFEAQQACAAAEQRASALSRELEEVAQQREQLEAQVEGVESARREEAGGGGTGAGAGAGAGTGTGTDDAEGLQAQLLEGQEEEWRARLEAVRAAGEEDVASALLQLEVAQTEVERQAERIRFLELANQAKVEEQASGGPRLGPVSSGGAAAAELENQRLLSELEASREEVLSRQGELEAARADGELAAEHSREQVALLQRLLDERSRQLAEASGALAERPSKSEYDDLKAQLAALQLGDNGAEQRSGQLRKELVDLRNHVNRLEKDNALLRDAEQRLGDALKDQSALVTRLEQEMEQFPPSAADQLGVVASSLLLDPDQRRQRPELLQPQPLHAQQEQTQQLQAQQQQQQQQSMLKAVCAQRDRLRQQLGDSEESVEQAKAAADEARRRLQTLQEDNVELYQRIRFLQSYKASERSTLLSNADVENNSNTKQSLGLGMGVEHKYRGAYEFGDASPLRAFQTKETERLTKNMPGVERVAVQVCNAFLARSRGRVFVTVYVLLLHTAVLLLLLL